ncbi:MAG: site-specific DNA-methyltransferase [Candidatus Sericytochromatia bacterium]|nr:site-specific DNA-methyltransferase [Candidatus Tanganyikabacteria bacterium]
MAPAAVPWRDGISLLIEGENLPVLAGLAGAGVRLAYLDPPFMTGDAFFVGDEEAYRDDLGPDAHLQMLYERLLLVREALAPDGTVCVHLDHHIAHAAKLVLDEAFGRFLNEIVWFYQGGALTGVRRHLPRKHDTLLWYAKGPQHVFHPPRQSEVSSQMQRRWGHYADRDGRIPFGRIRHEGQTYARLRRRFLRDHGREPADGDLAFTLQGSLVRSVWTDIPEVRNSPRYVESTGYPTQKPLALLERLIGMATDPGDLVLDPFCGSGTALLAAERLGRRWIGVDRGTQAIRVAAGRLAGGTFRRAALG